MSPVHELEVRNLSQSGPDAEYAVARLIGNIPLDLAAAWMQGAARRVERAGYDAYFKTETGVGVLWARRKRPEEDA